MSSHEFGPDDVDPELMVPFVLLARVYRAFPFGVVVDDLLPVSSLLPYSEALVMPPGTRGSNDRLEPREWPPLHTLQERFGESPVTAISRLLDYTDDQLHYIEDILGSLPGTQRDARSRTDEVHQPLPFAGSDGDLEKYIDRLGWWRTRLRGTILERADLLYSCIADAEGAELDRVREARVQHAISDEIAGGERVVSRLLEKISVLLHSYRSVTILHNEIRYLPAVRDFALEYFMDRGIVTTEEDEVRLTLDGLCHLRSRRLQEGGGETLEQMIVRCVREEDRHTTARAVQILYRTASWTGKAAATLGPGTIIPLL